ncbi:MAG: 23S rRNA (adenine(2503)-C(2))-methyltransferase RlmN [Bacteroidota bacterium]|nr:23S rRNA (adenine(2503)-C(2))-methyltransferase RlmN [Bacteroidota bacterium]
MERRNLFGFDEVALRAECAAMGLEPYRGTQLFSWLYNHGTDDFDAMTDFPKTVRASLARRYRIAHPHVAGERRSRDGTRKFVFELEDGLAVEAVLIPSEAGEGGLGGRLTLCLSTQVGCPLGCTFCATASVKPRRNLASGEIVGQYIVARSAAGGRITNIVYMGMGEPFLNYDAVMKSVEILTHKATRGVGASRITISTAGIPDGIRRMADERRTVKLAVSLHATTDEVRGRLMPVAKRYPLAEVIAAVEYYVRMAGRAVTWEYIVFEGVNDGPEDIRRLARLARRVPCKINLIPYHPIEKIVRGGHRFRSPSREDVLAFAASLKKAGVTVMVRSSAGADIEGACGQLAARGFGGHCRGETKPTERNTSLAPIPRESTPT